MAFLVLTQSDVEQLLPMTTCIDLVAEALSDAARGRIHEPPRSVFSPPGSSHLMALMPAYRSAPQPVYSLKALCAFPSNPAVGLDSNQGAVILFDGQNGRVAAVMNASAITAIRTAATSGVATRVLARQDARVLAILGSGIQARTHLEAMLCVRSFESVRVWSRTHEHAETFARTLGERFGLSVDPVDSAEAAVRGADVIVTATTAVAPIVQRRWLSAGAHVNAVGSSSPTDRELDAETIASSAVFVDRREAALNEAGDLLLAISEGVIRPEHIRAELGDVLVGRATGRTSPAEVTVFKSVGLAVEDLAAAEHLFRRAEEAQSGIMVDF